METIFPRYGAEPTRVPAARNGREWARAATRRAGARRPAGRVGVFPSDIYKHIYCTNLEKNPIENVLGIRNLENPGSGGYLPAIWKIVLGIPETYWGSDFTIRSQIFNSEIVIVRVPETTRNAKKHQVL